MDGISINGINIVKRSANAEEYIEMRKSAGWWHPEKETASAGLKHSLFSVCAEKDGKIIGYGRIVGDGAFTLYIQDILVKPEYQGLGIGKKIMNEIMSYSPFRHPEAFRGVCPGRRIFP
ncbi:MAG: GNAT family N-acetyltransferase [Acetivibrionales bacterium]|jgi:ribosomal protein S18 acetylase RimI-like enzyme